MPPLPICRGRCSPLSEKRNKNAVFLHIRERQHSSLSVQILYEKTEEAKRLLRYSDKPITAISYYLGFSSPSHFSRVFKARVCITPGEYREKHQ